MKKILKISLAAVLAVAVLVGIFAVAAGDAAVMFNGTNNEIEFRNVVPFAGNDKPDLFTNFKELMPGDSVSQEITIGATNVGTNKIKIHLRAENPNEDYRKLVEEYGRWVTFTVKNGNTEITGNLDTGVVLGEFTNNGTGKVTVSLAIDKLADNNLQDLVAEVDWIFTAEVIPTGGGGGGSFPGDDTPTLVDNHVNYIVGYTDGTVRPNAPITRAEVATIFYRLLTDSTRSQMWSTENIYTDVKDDDWFYVAVSTLTNGGILEGYGDGTFRARNAITRAELATIICRFDRKFGTIATTKSFKDVAGHWAESYIKFSAERGYVEGYPDGTFKPQQDITRAETMAMVNRLLQRGVDQQGLKTGYVQWTDNYRDTWYYYDVIEASTYHSYRRSTRPIEGKTFNYENWSAIREPINWADLESRWIRDFKTD